MKIIKIGAMWCPACLITNNNLDRIQKDYKIDIISLDYDFDEEKVKEYDVGEILPVLIFLDNNDREIERLIGEKTYKEIEGVVVKNEENIN